MQWTRNQCIQEHQHAIISELSYTRPARTLLFSSLLQHDVDNHSITEDFHSTQVMKVVVRLFLKMRLSRYAQEYTQVVVKKNALGKRQQMNKLMLFSGL